MGKLATLSLILVMLLAITLTLTLSAMAVQPAIQQLPASNPKALIGTASGAHPDQIERFDRDVPYTVSEDARNVEFVGHHDTPGIVRGLMVVGNYAYLADHPLWDGSQWIEGGLRIVEVSNPVSPTEVSFYDTPGCPQNVVIKADYAYLADGPQSSGLRTIRITDPISPTEEGSIDTPSGYALDVAVQGSYAYVGYGNGLQVVRVADPSNPVEEGSRDMVAMAEGVAVAGDYVYIADWAGGLCVVDVSDPAHPTVVGRHLTPHVGYDVAVSGDYAYFAGGSGGLRVVDITTPTDPLEVGFHITPHWANGVVISGDVAYVTDHEAGLRVVDVSDPATPIEVGFYDTPGIAQAVDVAGDYVYVGAGESGFFVLRYSGAPAAVTVTGPTTGLVNGAYTFTTAVIPSITSTPITYTWEATNHSVVTQTGDLTDAATFAWSVPGLKRITVTAMNGAGTVSNVHTIAIESCRIHLPIVFRMNTRQ
jgi:hypothetical protein